VGVNFTEIIVVCVVALLLFGPDQLPTLAKQVGKIMGELRRGSNSLRREFYNTVYPPDVSEDLRSGARAVRSLKAEIMAPPPGSAALSSSRPTAAPQGEGETSGASSLQNSAAEVATTASASSFENRLASEINDDS
jgi:TatA/E family protein of Tat protein translocase